MRYFLPRQRANPHNTTMQNMKSRESYVLLSPTPLSICLPLCCLREAQVCEFFQVVCRYLADHLLTPALRCANNLLPKPASNAASAALREIKGEADQLPPRVSDGTPHVCRVGVWLWWRWCRRCWIWVLLVGCRSCQSDLVAHPVTLMVLCNCLECRQLCMGT